MTPTASTTPASAAGAVDLRLGDVLSALDALYPPARAAGWDRVGLVTGDPEQPVRRILAVVDPTLAVIEDARDGDFDLIIAHHPLLLRGVHSVATTTAKGASITSLVVADIALYVAHTNADSADPGVNTELARAAGLSEDAEVLDVSEQVPIGRVGDLAEPTTLGEFAQRLAGRLPEAPAGLRVSGPADAPITRVAVASGAGDNLFDAVRASGADLYVTADLRHHPALEAREEGRGGPPYLIDAGHWASEWLWLASVRRELGRALTDAGHEVGDDLVTVSTRRTDPWDFLVPTTGRATDEGDVR